MDCIGVVEIAYVERFQSSPSGSLILRTDNFSQYTANEFRESLSTMGIHQEYIQKNTSEDNKDIESFHNSIKTDYIWPNEPETFKDAQELVDIH